MLIDFEYYKRVGLSGNDLIEKCEEQVFDLNLEIVLLFVKKQGKQEISELNQAERNQLLAIIWDKHKLGFAQRLYGVANTDKSLKNNELRSFHDRVTMVLDAEVDGAYPRRWLGRVSVQTRDGRTLECRVDTPKGDPDNTLSRTELEDKAQRLVSYSGAATPEEMKQVIARIWRLRNETSIRDFMAGR